MIRVRQVKVLVEKDNKEELLWELSKKLRCNKDDIEKIKIIKRSVDARYKPIIYYSYVIDVKIKNEKDILRRFKNNNDIELSNYEDYKVNIKGNILLKNKPIIVGSGPCGLICGYMLAKYGYKPIIIERGKDVDDRIVDVENFWETGKLNINSNVQFGEGGAGTFSDGKLNTLVKDKLGRGRKVFEILVENGAKEEILYESKPHIGTDELRKIVKNIRKKIIKMGGEVRFESCLTDIIIDENKVKGIVINDKDVLETDILVLALGHSARDTFKMLYDKGIKMEGKSFAVGVRIQHKQEMINESQYGVKRHPILKNASYKLTYKSSQGRGVYTFCMCPGGYVVNAASENGGITVNGMSNYNRDSGNANSAVVVTVSPDDFGKGPLDGVEFQRKLERRAYEIGNGKIPIMKFGDYVNRIKADCLGKIAPIFKGRYVLSIVNDIFPEFINEAIIEGIYNFDKKIKGFADKDAIIAGPEARTSSPVRIIRDEEGVANIVGIYPAGEGAGYAGGITTSGIDGLVVFEKIVDKYIYK